MCRLVPTLCVQTGSYIVCADWFETGLVFSPKDRISGVKLAVSCEYYASLIAEIPFNKLNSIVVIIPVANKLEVLNFPLIRLIEGDREI